MGFDFNELPVIISELACNQILIRFLEKITSGHFKRGTACPSSDWRGTGCTGSMQKRWWRLSPHTVHEERRYNPESVISEVETKTREALNERGKENEESTLKSMLNVEATGKQLPRGWQQKNKGLALNRILFSLWCWIVSSWNPYVQSFTPTIQNVTGNRFGNRAFKVATELKWGH